MKCMATIANQLADVGHEVTYFQPFVLEEFKDHQLIKNPNIEVMNYWHDAVGKNNLPNYKILSNAWISEKKILKPKVFYHSFEHMCRKMFEDKQLHLLLKKKAFDVVLSETFDFCGLYLADYIGMPTIISVFSGVRLNAIRTALGEPSSLHYMPTSSSKSLSNPTIHDRFKDLWRRTFATEFSELFDLQFELATRITDEKVRHWKQILNDVTYHFTNENPYLDFVVPTIPKVIPIGGYTMDYTNVPPVPEEIDVLLNTRPFTVFISYGSMVTSKSMPEDYKKGMIQMFLQNSNVTFLWKYEDPEEKFLETMLPDNVYVAKWFPQQSLLADKRVNMFITHGGLGSVMELAYAAKPAIVTPLFADQPYNAQMLSQHGSAEIYSKFDVPNGTKQSALLREMLTNEKYQIAATRLAEILSHQPIRPKEVMIKHAEHAARFGRIPTLTPSVKDMDCIEFYNLDIIILSFLFLSIVAFGLMKILFVVSRRLLAEKTKLQLISQLLFDVR